MLFWETCSTWNTAVQKTTKIGNTSRLSRDGMPAASRALDVKSSLKSFTLTPYFAYGMFGNERASADALGGLRYYHAGSQIDAEVRNFGKQTVATSDNWGRQILRIFSAAIRKAIPIAN